MRRVLADLWGLAIGDRLHFWREVRRAKRLARRMQRRGEL